MVVFDGRLNFTKFQECLQYVQDTMDWLIASEAERYLRQVIGQLVWFTRVVQSKPNVVAFIY